MNRGKDIFFLASGLDMGDQHPPPLIALSSGKGTSTHFTGGLMDLGPVLYVYGKSRPPRGFVSRTVHPGASRCTD